MGIKVNMSGAHRKIQATQNAISQGSMEGADAVAEELAARVRVDAPVDTGALRDSVSTRGGDVVVGVDYAEFVNRRTQFVTHNVDSIRSEAARIVDDEVRRRLP